MFSAVGASFAGLGATGRLVAQPMKLRERLAQRRR